MVIRWNVSLRQIFQQGQAEAKGKVYHSERMRLGWTGGETCEQDRSINSDRLNSQHMSLVPKLLCLKSRSWPEEGEPARTLQTCLPPS